MNPSPAASTEGTLDAESDAVLGTRLRELRKESGMSLRALARELGISASAVSQIERGHMQPSVNRLIAMTTALGVPLTAVFEPAVVVEEAEPVVEHSYVLARSGQIAPVKLEDGVVFRSLAPVPMPRVQFFESTYPPGSRGSLHGDLLQHEGFEVGQVIRGELTIVFDNERVVLRAGDSITFPCTVPHLIVNDSKDETVATWLIANVGS